MLNLRAFGLGSPPCMTSLMVWWFVCEALRWPFCCLSSTWCARPRSLEKEASLQDSRGFKTLKTLVYPEDKQNFATAGWNDSPCYRAFAISTFAPFVSRMTANQGTTNQNHSFEYGSKLSLSTNYSSLPVIPNCSWFWGGSGGGRCCGIAPAHLKFCTVGATWVSCPVGGLAPSQQVSSCLGSKVPGYCHCNITEVKISFLGLSPSPFNGWW